MANIMNNLINFLLGFALNLIASIVIIRFIYYPSNQNKPYVFTFMALGTTLFFVLSLLTSIELSVGVGFGLFAIFSILRYRTDTIPIRDMTYLFVIAALSVMNAAGSSSAAWPQLMIANLGLVILLFVLEREWGFQFELSKEVVRKDRADRSAAPRRVAGRPGSAHRHAHQARGDWQNRLHARHRPTSRRLLHASARPRIACRRHAAQH